MSTTEDGFVGVDVSKARLDVAIRGEDEVRRAGNDEEGIGERVASFSEFRLRMQCRDTVPLQAFELAADVLEVVRQAIDPKHLEGQWTSSAAVEANVGTIGVLEIALQVNPQALGGMSGTWTLGLRSGDVSFVLRPASEGDTVQIQFSGQARVYGAWSGDVISGVIRGSLIDDGSDDGIGSNDPTWIFDETPVTLSRQN